MNEQQTSKLDLDVVSATGKEVESIMKEFCVAELFSNKQLFAIIKNSLNDVGLRIHPYLLRVSYEAGGGSFDEIIQIAAGIELIQLSTLVIDDVLDNSDVRSGRQTVYRQWGTELAFISGSVMASLGLYLASANSEQVADHKCRLAALRLLLLTHSNIYIGQFMDLQFEKDNEISETN